ncbi:MAG: AMP-binding protein [Clostridia bacterium]|jgi:long-chain acyl-CoA synthetase|nr:AMP-binding protein [Clostridia bacterium]
MANGIYDYMKITDLKDMLNKIGEKYGEKEAFKFKTETPGVFRTISFKKFVCDVNALGTKLIDLGLKDKRIAVISENRYEWGVGYLAAVCGTGIVVPMDRALPENEIRSLIERSEVEVIIYSKKYNEIMQRVKEDEISKIKYYISMDSEKEENSILSMKELIEKGNNLIKDGDKRFIEAKIDPEKMSIMLFTSGTTSKSKAVALSHKNICTNIQDIASMFDINTSDTFLSFLPLHHTFESTVGFLYVLYAGAAIAYCDGIKHLAENIKEYQITAMISVPILYENMYKKVLRGIEKKGKMETFQKGLKISKFLRKYLHIDIRRKIFRDIHELLGGKVRLFINGAAALDPVVEQGFNDIGINMAQGYGLTETSPVLAAGNGLPKYSRIGSVGRAFPSVELKIEDPDENGIGEVIAKADSVMLEYYGNEEATKEAIVNGWFHTGDLGYFDKDKFLYITGRKKTVIVLKNGKNIYPEEIEGLIGRIDGVKESFVFGVPSMNNDEKESKINAEIVYDEERMNEILENPNEEKIKEYLWENVKEINKTMPAYKYIREIIVTKEELIKTTTQKVKRHEEIKKVLGK